MATASLSLPGPLRAAPASGPPDFILDADVGETTNLADRHPDVVESLLALAEKAREDLGDIAREGKNRRPAGMVKNPKPRQEAKP